MEGRRERRGTRFDVRAGTRSGDGGAGADRGPGRTIEHSRRSVSVLAVRDISDQVLAEGAGRQLQDQIHFVSRLLRQGRWRRRWRWLNQPLAAIANYVNAAAARLRISGVPEERRTISARPRQARRAGRSSGAWAVRAARAAINRGPERGGAGDRGAGDGGGCATPEASIRYELGAALVSGSGSCRSSR